MPPSFILLGLLLAAAVYEPTPKAAAVAPPTTAALKNCSTQCGSVSVPYPFGFGRPGCYRWDFEVECNSSSIGPQIRLPGSLLALSKVVTVSNVTLEAVTIQLGMAVDCTGTNPTTATVITELGGSPYTLSNTRNKLVVLGCDSYGIMMETTKPVSRCHSSCSSNIVNGTCSDSSGCCRAVINNALKYFSFTAMRSNGTNRMITACSYAFIMDADQYVFRSTDLSNYLGSRHSWSVPVVLDWAIGSYNCSMARAFRDYACGTNADCVDSTSGPGYRCSCVEGYKGNPYLADGCQDINECEDPKMNSCSDVCTNLVGSYSCSCPEGTHGDGLRIGKGCIHEMKKFPLLQVILGCGISFLFLLLTVSSLYWFLRKRHLKMMRKKFFKENGGLIMQKIILSKNGVTQIAKLFTEHDLKRATNKYNEERVLGKGGFGTVYKGILQDMKSVAIKKSKIEDPKHVDQFINEIIILSQINHKNVVKIIGCCLETHVPLLVYEYIPNRTLDYHIHDANRVSSLSWETRLRIAVEIADALAYLHFFSSQPIIHRDIKSTNILLDDNYTAMVSDFGISKIVQLHPSEASSALQGTPGYMDPESIEKCELTTKSDVYSFGVILVELLTGQMPIMAQNKESILLAYYFVDAMNKYKLVEVLEPRVRDEGNWNQIQKFGNIAKDCLSLKGHERPTMRDVATKLTEIHDGQIPTTNLYEENIRCVGTNPLTKMGLSSTTTKISIMSTNDVAEDSTINWSDYIR